MNRLARHAALGMQLHRNLGTVAHTMGHGTPEKVGERERDECMGTEVVGSVNVYAEAVAKQPGPFDPNVAHAVMMSQIGRAHV